MARIFKLFNSKSEEEYHIDDHFKGSSKKVINWFEKLDKAIKGFDEEIYHHVAKSTITF